MSLDSARTALLPRLDAASDRLSPLVVKEVRQFVRGREFLASFGIGLCLAMAIAASGSTDALGGSQTAGRWTFGTLMVCISLLGLAIVPIGAYGMLRTERMEQTLELISLTTLSPRQIIVGKLLAQGVKLTTFFAVMAPFMATSFLLGGIDFVTILLGMVAVFLWSMWAAAAALFLSTLFTSRVMTGLALGGLGLGLFIAVNIGRMLFFTPFFVLGGPFGTAGPVRLYWLAGVMTVACLMTMANLVLLAEHRLALPTQNTLTSLRIGFFAQFLLILSWGIAPALVALWPPVMSLGGPGGAIDSMAAIAGMHLAAVALFAVTALPEPSGRPWASRAPTFVKVVLGLDGWPVTGYILVQMLLLVVVALALSATAAQVRWILAICGAICLFTGVPALLVRRFHRWGIGAFQARGLAIALVFVSLVASDVGYYALTTPDFFSMRFTWRHVFNPVRTLFEWNTVEAQGWHLIPMLWSVLGLCCYVVVTALDLRARDAIATLEPVTLSIEAGDDRPRA